MTTTTRLSAIAFATLVVLSAVAVPVLAGDDGGLTSGVEDTLDGDDDGLVDGTADTVGETTDGTTDTDPTSTLSSTSSSGYTDAGTDGTSGDDGSADYTATAHDWPMAGYQPTHVGINPDTTGPNDTLGTAWVAGSPNVTGGPVVSGGTVYAVNESGTAFARYRNGSLAWETTLAVGDLDVAPTVHSGPAVVNGTVYYAGDGPDAGYVVAVDASDGSQLWATPVGSNVRSAPTVRDGVVYVGSAPSGATGIVTGERGPLTALDAGDGSLEWTNTDLDAEVAAAPTVTDSGLFAATTAGTLYRVNAEDGTVAEDTSVTSAPVHAAPTVADGTVYVAANDSRVHAVAASDLSPFNTSEDLGGAIVGSLAVHDGTVYAASTGKRVAALEPVTLETRTTIELLRPITSSLTMVDGTVYVPTSDGMAPYDSDLERISRVDPDATIGTAVTPSAGRAYVGTSDGLLAVRQLCENDAIGADTVSVPIDCVTIDSALGAVATGGTVVLEAGTYEESVQLSRPVTLRGENATLDGEDERDVAIEVTADDVTIAGLDVRNYDDAGIVADDVSGLAVRDVTVHKVVHGIRLSPDGGSLEDVTLAESDVSALGSALWIEAGAATTVSNVTVDGGRYVSSGGGSGIDLDGEGADVTGFAVRDVSFPAGSGLTVHATDGAAVADVSVTDVRLDSGYSVSEGVAFVAGDGGAGTLTNVTVADLQVDGPYETGIRVIADGGSGDATATVDDVTVTDGRFTGTGTAVLLAGTGAGAVGQVDVTNATIKDNDVGVRLAAGDADDVSVVHSAIANNTDAGVVNDGTGLLNATYNWWGNVTGPYDAATPDTDPADENPNGTGDVVSDGVTYRPWVSPPEAVIETTPPDATVNVSEPVAFTARNSTDGYGDVESYHWDFGDGTEATGENVTHSYEESGTYSVTLTVTDSLGDSATAKVTVEVVDDSGETETATPSETDTPSETETATETETETETETATETPTQTESPTPTPTQTETESPTPTPTQTETETPSETESPTPTSTETETETPTESSPTSTETNAGGGSGGDDSGSDSSGGGAPPASGGGGGSGSGGGDTATPTPTRETRVTFADGTVRWIEFGVPVDGDVTVEDLDSLPSGMEAPQGHLLTTTRITVPPDLEDASATIRFTVATSALEDANVAAADVRLARYDDGWQRLDTRIVDRTDDHVLFEAETPGFSVFAAVGAAESDTPTVTPSPTTHGTDARTDSPTDDGTGDGETESSPALGVGDQTGPFAARGLGPEAIAGLLALVVLLVGGLVVRRRLREDDDYEPPVRS